MDIQAVMILLLHDNEETVKKIQKHVIHKKNFQITVLRKPQDLVSALKHIHFDIILADYELAQKTSHSIVATVKKIIPHLPIVLLGPELPEKKIVKILEKGVTDFVFYDKLEVLEHCITRAVNEAKEKEERKKIQFLLEESQERYEKLVQSIPDVVYRLDENGYITFISDAIKNFGYEPKELIGKHFSVLLHEEDVPRVSREIVLPQYFGKVTGPENAPKLFDERRTGSRMTRNLEVRLAGERIYNKDALSHSGEKIHWVEVFSTGDYIFPEEENLIRIEKNNKEDMVWIEITSTGEYDTTSKGTERKFLGTVGLIRDIRQRHKMEEERKELIRKLEISNQELKQFAYVASHDLREPIRMITSFLNLIQKKIEKNYAEDPELKEFITYALDGALRMEQLINDLLKFSRIETHGKEFSPVNLKELSRILLLNLKVIIAETGANVFFPENMPVVLGDSIQITQLFQNLIENAIKYRKKDTKPEVYVSFERKNNEYQFCIKDNGIGIAKEYFDRIFIIFQRLHTREEYSGNGIGLALCKKIVERHKGRIWVESEVGVGSSFYFTLPAVD